MCEQVEFQREVTRRVFSHLGSDTGFALAGSGAIREYGLIDRPTEDIDLFTNRTQGAPVLDVVDDLVRALVADGYTVTTSRVSGTFARLTVTRGLLSTQVDLGVDWRLHPALVHEGGNVLALEDAVANKVGALYSRGLMRDYLDVDAIRASGRFSDEELLSLAQESDPGFDRAFFAQALEASQCLSLADAQPFGLTPEDLVHLVRRCMQWAQSIRQSLTLKEPIQSHEQGLGDACPDRGGEIRKYGRR